MRRAAALAFVAALSAAAARVADAQEAVRRSPAVGYLYPAGGQRGATVRVTAGGQFLAGASAAYVSGDGVKASVVHEMKPLTNEQRQELGRRIAEIRESRRPGAGRGAARRAAKGAGDEETVELPDYPVLRDLEHTTEKGLDEIAARFLGFGGKRQLNAQLADVVELELEIDPRAAPGEREIRLATPLGLTNPLRFEVGAYPETSEQDTAQWHAESPAVLATPVVVDGQIVPGDVDRFRFRASRGQRLVVTTQARSLVPFLADAVPGWFQPVVSISDARGRELLCADHFRFDPDPVLFFEAPTEGEYELTIRDALFRGREDFVYRVTIAETPFITRMFPLGVREGAPRAASVEGWNLLREHVALDASSGGDPLRWASAPRDGAPGNRVAYRVDDWPEIDEATAGGAQHAQTVALPVIVNGRIERAGEVHAFRFDGRAGDEIVADVEARRLGSPLDSVLRLVDASGAVVAWNDDFDDGAPGVLTQHADSHVSARLPADGRYEVRISDAQGHGGPESAYRLRIGAPRPDFDVVVTPSSLNVPAGRATPFRITAVRKDGFDGEIVVGFVGPSSGFALQGARIPPGRNSVRMTITAPSDAPSGPIVLRIEGRATIGGAEVRRAAVPAEDRMQAFAYRHLVPAQELMALVTGPRRRMPPISATSDAPVRIPAGATARVLLAAPGVTPPPGVRLVLDDSSPEIALEGWSVGPRGIELVLGASPVAGKPGAAGNAVVEVLAEIPAARAKSGDAAQPKTYSLGFLPAVAFEIVGARARDGP